MKNIKRNMLVLMMVSCLVFGFINIADARIIFVTKNSVEIVMVKNVTVDGSQIKVTVFNPEIKDLLWEIQIIQNNQVILTSSSKIINSNSYDYMNIFVPDTNYTIEIFVYKESIWTRSDYKFMDIESGGII